MKEKQEWNFFRKIPIYYNDFDGNALYRIRSRVKLCFSASKAYVYKFEFFKISKIVLEDTRINSITTGQKGPVP